MRKDLSEPQLWRDSDRRDSQRSQAWASNRPRHQRTELAAEAVDAALAETVTEASTSEQFATSDIVASLASQLDLLEQQREQLQRLLDQAQTER